MIDGVTAYSLPGDGGRGVEQGVERPPLPPSFGSDGCTAKPLSDEWLRAIPPTSPCPSLSPFTSSLHDAAVHDLDEALGDGRLNGRVEALPRRLRGHHPTQVTSPLPPGHPLDDAGGQLGDQPPFPARLGDGVGDTAAWS